MDWPVPTLLVGYNSHGCQFVLIMEFIQRRKRFIKGTVVAALLVMVMFAILRTDITDKVVMVVTRPEDPLFACPTFPGRLGNHIYHYASVYGLAKLYNLTIILARDDNITKFFKVPSAVIKKDRSICNRFIEGQREIYCCRFDKSLVHLKRKSYRFGNYLQSWKYFEGLFPQIRKELEFRDDIKDYARKIVWKFKYDFVEKHGFDKLVVVGLHIRRGDTVKSKTLKSYIFVPDGYVYRAMDYFLTKYSSANVIFVVCSDGLDFAREVIEYKNVTALFVSNSPIKDLAVLAECDHVIMTYGTFGWWAGFLAGGEVVFYKYPITEGSMQKKSYNYDEFFPPNWTGLD